MGNRQGTAPVALKKRLKGQMPYVADTHVRGLEYHEHKLTLLEGRSEDRRWKCVCACGWTGTGMKMRGAALGAARHHLAVIRKYYRDNGLAVLPPPTPADRIDPTP